MTGEVEDTKQSQDEHPWCGGDQLGRRKKKERGKVELASRDEKKKRKKRWDLVERKEAQRKKNVSTERREKTVRAEERRIKLLVRGQGSAGRKERNIHR